jgi:hypothetical protein
MIRTGAVANEVLPRAPIGATLLIVTPPPSKPFDATIRHNGGMLQRVQGDMMCEPPPQSPRLPPPMNSRQPNGARKLADEAGTLMAQLI